MTRTQAHTITTLRSLISENQAPYLQLGKLRESERDALEEEVATYVRSCSTNIAKLQAMLRTAPASSPAKRLPPSTDLIAHRQGMVLILSERLGTLTTAFDRLRSLRYQQLQQAETHRQRRLPRSAAAPTTSAALHDHVHGDGRQQGDSATHRTATSQQQQVLVDAENQALQVELLTMGDQVQHAERTVREIATLNQMFSTAILHQSEQIEKLYSEAVAATHNIGRANVQLDKAIRTNKSAQKIIFILLLLASLTVLFLDWFYS
jgi:syntaxin 18